MATCKDCIHYNVCRDYYNELASDCDKMEFLVTECNNHFTDKSRFVELPCKVGDTFYCLTQYYARKGLGDYFVSKRQVSSFEFDARGLTIWDYDGLDFSENVFFTREEAEAKLKEIQK